jgi:hypothetical protein
MYPIINYLFLVVLAGCIVLIILPSLCTIYSPVCILPYNNSREKGVVYRSINIEVYRGGDIGRVVGIMYSIIVNVIVHIVYVGRTSRVGYIAYRLCVVLISSLPEATRVLTRFCHNLQARMCITILRLCSPHRLQIVLDSIKNMISITIIHSSIGWYRIVLNGRTIKTIVHYCAGWYKKVQNSITIGSIVHYCIEKCRIVLDSIKNIERVLRTCVECTISLGRPRSIDASRAETLAETSSQIIQNFYTNIATLYSSRSFTVLLTILQGIAYVIGYTGGKKFSKILDHFFQTGVVYTDIMYCNE